jgi:hypothetical protein
VAHTYNPSYSGHRDQEDHGSKPAQTNRSRDPILKNPITKNWAGGVPQGEGPEFKPTYHKKIFFKKSCLISPTEDNCNFLALPPPSVTRWYMN